MKLSFVVPGEPQPSQPAVMMPSGKLATPKRAREYEEHARYHAMVACVKHDWSPKKSDRFRVRLRFFVGNERVIDGDNCERACLNAGKRGLVFVDDAHVVECHWSKHVDKDHPRVEVTVEKVT